MAIEKILKFIWNEFIYTGHFLSLGAVSIVFTSAILLGIKITWDCLLVVYLGIHSAYLFNRYKELKIDLSTNPERTLYLQKHIKYIPFIISFYALLMTVILVFFNKTSVIIFGLVLFLIGLLYSIFLKECTKKIIGFKNYFVSLMWTLLIIFLAFYYFYPLNLTLILILIFVYLRCFMDTNFYDIKDIESDKKENLLTLAIVFGRKGLLRFLNLINVIALLPIILGVYLELFPMFSLILLFVIPITFYLLKKLEIEKINIAYLSEIAIGTEKISWSFLVLFGKFLL
ncbi:UbiA family prenyltransferase [Candidatus Parcubacteria bacterium]|nr:UbiA family prenyltransferase [Candidatus Parcubacteria bacterium]